MLKEKPDALSNDKFPKTNLYKAVFFSFFYMLITKVVAASIAQNWNR